MKKLYYLLVLFAILYLPLTGSDNLPDPDGKEADMSKPVQVFILLGQSNMLGFGKTSTLKSVCQNQKLYPYLIDDSGNWTVRKDVRNVRIMCSGNNPSKTHLNDWLSVGTGIGGRKGRGNIGTEIAIGHHLGNAIKAPVLILKSCIGNRSLGWDLLPPGSKQYTYNGRKFYNYIERNLKFESRSKKERSERKAESLSKYLENMAEKFGEDSVYAKAAKKAAKEIKDPKNPIKEPGYYLK